MFGAFGGWALVNLAGWFWVPSRKATMKGDRRRTGTATTPDKGKGHEQQGGEAEAVKQNAAR